MQSRSEYIDARAAQFDQIVNLMYALLALAAIITLVNIANSLVLSINERTAPSSGCFAPSAQLVARPAPR